MKSLRNTLILSILLPILVVFILLGFVFMQFMEKKSTKEGDAAMESSAVQMGSAVDTILSEIETRIGVIELAVTDIPDQERIQAKDLDYFKSFEGNMNNLLVDGTKDIPRPGSFLCSLRSGINLRYLRNLLYRYGRRRKAGGGYPYRFGGLWSLPTRSM